MSNWSLRRSQVVQNRGRFIVFEGIDGCGKSTQARLLASRLEGVGIPVLLTAEPSEGPIGRTIRSLSQRMDPEQEADLFTKDRQYHVERVILPSLADGRTVISDRYVYSSVAYQGARGVDPGAIISRNKPFAIAPDVIFLLEVPLDVALERIGRSRPDGISLFEQRKDLEMVETIYRNLADPLLKRIDAARTVTEIHQAILDHLEELPDFDELRSRLMDFRIDLQTEG